MNTAFSDPTGRAIPFGLSPPAFRSPDETTKEEVGLAKAVKVVEQRRSGIEVAKLVTQALARTNRFHIEESHERL